jgi:hypothetical protein
MMGLLSEGAVGKLVDGMVVAGGGWRLRTGAVRERRNYEK